MPVTKIITQGCSGITDGREFVVECFGQKNGGKPMLGPPELVQYKDPGIRILGAVSSAGELNCPECPAICSERVVLFHTDGWMYTAFICPSHKKNLFLDVFPKVTGDTGWDYTNAFAADYDRISNPALPEGVVIKNYAGPGERKAELCSRIADMAAWTLTFQGCIPPKRQLLREIKRRIRNLFS